MLYDSIIIGGGPAGMTAGIYLSRKKLKSLLITRDFIGQVGGSSLVENYPGFESIIGIELIKKIREHLYKNSNTEIIRDETVEKIKKSQIKGQGIFTIFTDLNNYKTKTVIVATGATYRKLGVLGEKEFFQKGSVSHCSVCDAPLFQDKFVAVVGGGNAGVTAVIDLLPYAKRISLLEYESELRADPVLIDKIKKEKNAFIFLNSELKEIKGDKKIDSILFFNHKDKKEFIMPVHGVFIKAGVKPNTSFLDKEGKFRSLLNKKGEIMINNYDCSTKIPGFFAAGDVTNVRDKQIVVATGEGAKAALSVFGYLKLKK